MKTTLLFLLSISWALHAAESPRQEAALVLTAGAARLEMTPNPEMMNGVNRKPYGSVLDPLFVRAVVLAQGDTRVAIVAWDLVVTREAAVADARAAITRATGIAEDHILINASHTHSAPFPPNGAEGVIEPERKLTKGVEATELYRAWSSALPGWCAEAVRKADAARRPATLGISRAWVGEVLFNRRPVREDGSVLSTLVPENPYSLPAGQRFGPVDPTLTLLSVRDDDGKTVAALFHLACHAVSVYGSQPGHHEGISADWPGPVAAALQAALGGEALFLQGCAGDIVPWRRGVARRDEMAARLAERALAAETNRHPLPVGRLQAARKVVELRLTEEAARETGAPLKTSEVQVIAMGSLALVALPGEPLTALGQEIRRQSPFPHTIVLGYSNGSGVQYVDVPGEKAKGGYEMGPVGLGTDNCGEVLIDTAVALLKSAAEGLPPR